MYFSWGKIVFSDGQDPFSDILYSSLSTNAVLDTKKDAIYLINSQKKNNVCTRSTIENFIKCDIKPFVSMFPTWEFPYETLLI